MTRRKTDRAMPAASAAFRSSAFSSSDSMTGKLFGRLRGYFGYFVSVGIAHSLCQCYVAFRSAIRNRADLQMKMTKENEARLKQIADDIRALSKQVHENTILISKKLAKQKKLVERDANRE
jgi:hypothetical protein